PNTGKSSLHARLTGSNAHVAPYPFTTQFPEPGMLPHQDIHFQLVDLPPVAREHPVPWLAATLQSADAAILVVDLGEPACLEQLQASIALLAEKRVTFTHRWDGTLAPDDDPFAQRLPALLVANKSDAITGSEAELRAFMELGGFDFPSLVVSAQTGHN